MGLTQLVELCSSLEAALQMLALVDNYPHAQAGVARLVSCRKAMPAIFLSFWMPALTLCTPQMPTSAFCIVKIESYLRTSRVDGLQSMTSAMYEGLDSESAEILAEGC